MCQPRLGRSQWPRAHRRPAGRRRFSACCGAPTRIEAMISECLTGARHALAGTSLPAAEHALLEEPAIDCTAHNPERRHRTHASYRGQRLRCFHRPRPRTVAPPTHSRRPWTDHLPPDTTHEHNTIGGLSPGLYPYAGTTSPLGVGVWIERRVGPVVSSKSEIIADRTARVIVRREQGRWATSASSKPCRRRRCAGCGHGG